MVARSEKESRQRAPLWLAGILLLNFGLMSYDAQDEVTNQRLIRVWAQAAVAPVQRVAASIGSAATGAVNYVGGLRHAAAENEQLRERLAQSETELREARAARDENERLRGLLGFKEATGYAMIPARVIARDPSAWFNTVVINRGSSAGVGLNMPVVTKEGIVGRVVATSPWTAQVMLITDERAAAGAVVGQLGTSNAVGSVRGYGNNGLLEMRYVSGLEQVNVDDAVVTTGQDGIYPPNLSVGQVVEITPGSATTPHVIHVRPSARLGALEDVAVLQYQPPQRPAPDKVLPNVDKGKKQ